LRCPVGGNFLTTHSPDFFGVTLEECVEQSFAKLIANPFLEIFRIPDREQTSFQPGKNAQNRFENAKLQQGFNWLERIREKFAAIKNAR